MLHIFDRQAGKNRKQKEIPCTYVSLKYYVYSIEIKLLPTSSSTYLLLSRYSI